MTIDPMSLPRSKQSGQSGVLAIQGQAEDQEEGKNFEEDFIIQVAKRAKEEWETFHLEHPDVDEETFLEAQRYCLKQWFLQEAILLCDLPAFQRAENHFEYEVKGRAAEVTAITTPAVMRGFVYWEAQSLGAQIAAQAQERSKRARKIIEELSSNAASGLVGAINKLRVVQQAQEWKEEVQRRLEGIRQDIEYIKELGIAIEYEKQKVELRQHEKGILEQLSTLGHLVGKSHSQIDLDRYIANFEECVGNIDIILEYLYSKTLDTYRAQDVMGTLSSDRNTGAQRRKYAQDQLKVWEEFIRAIQESIQDTLQKMEAEIQYIQKVKNALKRTRKRRARIEKWVKAEKVMQTKAGEGFSKMEEKFSEAIQRARSKAKQAIEHLESISAHLSEMKASYLKIIEKGVRCTKSLEQGRQALQRAVRAAEISPKDAHDAFGQPSQDRSLPNRGDDAIPVEEQARQAAKEEMEAYAQAKKYATSAIQHLRDMVSEQKKVEDTSEVIINLSDGLKDTLPFEQEILDSAITGVKKIVKLAMRVIKLEKQVKEVTHQMAAGIETASLGTNTSGLMASEQEALRLAAFANDALAAYAASYHHFQKLAVEMTEAHVETWVDAKEEQIFDALEEAKKYVEEIWQEKERKDVERQARALASTEAKGQAHLLIDERTGAITLKDGRAAFHMQDLADIDEVPAEEQLGHSKLWFKAGHPCSSYDVAHDLLHEQCEGRTSIHLQAPDGAGGHMAMLSLPNGTQIKVTDIDLEQTSYDPTQPERGITITLKRDGRKINLLAAASVMRETLSKEALRELADKSLSECIDQLKDALDTKDIEAIEDAFEDIKNDDRYKKYVDKCIISSKDINEREKQLMQWMESIANGVREAVYILIKYMNKVLDEENGEREINEVTVIEHGMVGDVPDERFQKRNDCLQRIVREKGLDTIIDYPLFNDPEDSSAGRNPRPTAQEVFVEYERARAWQVVEQRQDNHSSGLSDKWTSYLAQLRRAILDQVPSYLRTQFLINQLMEAVEADRWEQGTVESPGVRELEKELAAGPSSLNGQDNQEDNDYAEALERFTQCAVVGLQDAIQTAVPPEILSRIGFLELAFSVIEFVEAKVGEALSPMTPTVLARESVKQILSMGTSIKEQWVSDRRKKKGR